MNLPDARHHILVLGMLLLSACGELPVRDQGDAAPARAPNLTQTPDAVPRAEPLSKYGNPESYDVFGRTYVVMKSAKGYVERGRASWYGVKFHGQPTSSREPYNMYSMTAAHKTLPLPTYVRVTNLENGLSTIVRVNDRGPFHDDRIIDLSYAAANKLGMLHKGTVMVEVRAIDADGLPVSTPPPTVTVTPQPGFRRDIPDGPPSQLIPSSLVPPPTPTPGVIYVQVGSFANRDNAERVRRSLAERERTSVFLHEAPHPEHRVVYRVRLGPFHNESEAERIAGRVADVGAGRPLLVHE